eukprot:CFRG6809T1
MSTRVPVACPDSSCELPRNGANDLGEASSITMPDLYLREEDHVEAALNAVISGGHSDAPILGKSMSDVKSNADRRKGPQKLLERLNDRRVATAPATAIHGHEHQHIAGGISPRVSRKNAEKSSKAPKKTQIQKLNMSSDDIDQLKKAFQVKTSITNDVNSAMEDAGMPRMSFCIPHRFLSTSTKIFSQHHCEHCEKKLGYKSKTWKCTECSVVAHEECRDQLPPKCGLRDTEMAGVNLQSLVNDSLLLPMAEAAARQGRSIPFVVEALLMKIEKEGIGQEGVYRVSGTHTEIECLRKMFTYGKPNLVKADVHSCTGLLKKYFREIIPEPLLTYDLHDDLIRAVALTNDEERASMLENLLNSRLPPVHFDVLCALMLHLHKVIELASHNKMTANNVATVFGPTLLRSRDTMQSLSCSGKHVVVVSSLLKLDRRVWEIANKKDDNEMCTQEGSQGT